MMVNVLPRLLAPLLALMLSASCTRPPRPLAASIPNPPGQNRTGCLDLQPGWRLRVVAPVVKPGGKAEYKEEKVEGNTITLSASHDLIGFETAWYAVESRRGRLALRLTAVELNQEGAIRPMQKPQAAVIPLRRSAAHLRMIFSLHRSDADHSAALLAAKDEGSLAVATEDLQRSPATACTVTRTVECYWIPKGVAVRAEHQDYKTPGGADWVDVL